MIRIVALLSLAGVLSAQPIVPSETGTVWIQPNIMDAAKGRVNNLSVDPSAQGGAWVDASKTAGINANPSSNPTAGQNSDLLVANPGQPGPLIPSGGVTAVKLEDNAAASASNSSAAVQAVSQAGTNETSSGNVAASSPSNSSADAGAATAVASVGADAGTNVGAVASPVSSGSNSSAVDTSAHAANVSARADDAADVSASKAGNAAVVAASPPVQQADHGADMPASIPVAAASNASSSDAHAVVLPVVASSSVVVNDSAPAAAASSNNNSGTVTVPIIMPPLVSPNNEPVAPVVPAASVAQAEPVALAASAQPLQPVAVGSLAPALALVSSDVNNVQSNQTFAIDPSKPIIAILPPGSNLTATWNSSGAAPSIQTAPLSIQKREAPAVIISGDQPVAVSTSQGNQSVVVESAKPVIAILPPGSNLSATIETAAAVAPVPPPFVVPALPQDVGVAIVPQQQSVAAVVPQSNVVAAVPQQIAISGVGPDVPPAIPDQNASSAAALALAHVPVVVPAAAGEVRNVSAEPEVKAAPVVVAVGANNALDNSANASAANITDVSANKASNAAVIAAAPPVQQADHGMDVPLILPAGTTDFNNTNLAELSKIPGAIPIPIANLAVGTGQTGVVQQVPATNNADMGDLILQNHRFELQIVDFEVSNAGDQSGDVLVNLTAGALPPLLAQTSALLNKDVTPIDPNNPKLLAPESTTNYQKVYGGSFAQKASIQHTVSLDLCGQIPDKGLLQVQVRPSGNGAGGLTPLQYTCPINLNIRTAPRETESFWSEVFPCAGTSGANVAKLWYKVRQWNIDWNRCQQVRPAPALA